MPKDIKKDNKTGLYVFRLPESLDNNLVDQFKDRKKKIVDVKSKHQYARKLVTDYLQGNLVYIDSSTPNGNGLLKSRTA